MKNCMLASVLGLSVLAGNVLAADVPVAGSTPATTQPTAADIPTLINQLGADSPRMRDQASIALRKLGKDALPALTRAKESDDPEVSTRAEAISNLINEDLNPKPQPRVDPFGGMAGPGVIRLNGVGGGGVIVGGGGGAVMSVRVVANGNDASKSIAIKENGKAINIEENRDGIKMTVTEPDKEGKDQTREYKAKDADTLKKESPEAFELYEKYTRGNKNNGVQIQINNGAMNLQRLQGINEREMQRLQKVMEQQRKLMELQQKQMQEMIQQLQIEINEVARPEEKPDEK